MTALPAWRHRHRRSAWLSAEERARAQGAFGLPFGLLMVLVCGGELFTGNTALVTAAVCPRHPALAARASAGLCRAPCLKQLMPCTCCRRGPASPTLQESPCTSAAIARGAPGLEARPAWSPAPHAVQVYEGKATLGQLAKNWLVSYAGNFLGSALVVALVAASGVMASAKAPAAVAVAKTSLTFAQARARARLR